MEIQLGGKLGGKAIVSEGDYDRVNAFKWSLDKKGYARGINNGKTLSMHGFIMNSKEGEIIDHIDGDRLNNKKENLRISDSIKNSQNRKVSDKKTSSKYKGVFYRKDMELYYMAIKLEGNYTKIGYFDSELVTAQVYDTFILKNKIEHAPLNFPDQKTELINKTYKPTKEIKQKENEYYGVNEYKENYYRTTVYNNKKTIEIKYSKSAEECARAHDEYYVNNKIYEKNLNFPEDYPDYTTKLNVKTLCEPYDDTSVKLIMSDKNITVLVDKDDYENIKFYRCSVFSNGEYIGFQINGKVQSIHRFIMNATDPKIFIDHINNDPHDNRKKNLRISNSKLNAQNQSKKKGATSKYIGVSYKKKEKLWRTMIRKDGKTILEKKFKNEEDAARWRDLFIIVKLPDDHYKKNFDWTDQEITEWKKKLNFV